MFNFPVMESVFCSEHSLRRDELETTKLYPVSNNPDNLCTFLDCLGVSSLFTCCYAIVENGKNNFSLPKVKLQFLKTASSVSHPTNFIFCFCSFTSQNANIIEGAQTNIDFLLFILPAQKLQTFKSLSCTAFSASDGRQSSLPPPTSETSSKPDSDFTLVPVLGLEPRHEVAGHEEEEDSSYEELDSDSACSVDSRPGSPVGGKHTLWKGDCGTQREIIQLGGQLDLDQIERNWWCSKHDY